MNRPLHPSKQVRSLETQTQILQATTRLLEKEPFESISVRRIIVEAGTSIGSFYGRFRDKNALLSVLYAEYESQLEKRLVQLRDSIDGARSLEQEIVTATAGVECKNDRGERIFGAEFIIGEYIVYR